MNILLSGLAGLLFGIGLIIAGMANPAKVLGFLDIAGRWDPSLALVMGGAIVVGSIAFAIAKRRGKSLLGLNMQWPQAKQVDRPLVVGNLMFGIGWGLAGICPGPALVLLGTSLGTGAGKALVFVAAMLAGMLIFEVMQAPHKGASINTAI
ncbi:DUF6691 family protein [Undibacterium sp.]|uniref:DUF6691 family protein n=1 Tax=Undibacterium sp. TaxID=1914977 RepID=UPI00374DE077